jgi:hypothetical protein
VNFFLPSSPPPAPFSAADIAVISAGACSGNYAKFWLNGQLIPNSPAGRGLNVVIFNGSTFQVKKMGNFDTHLSEDNAADFVEFVGNFTDDGDVIAVGGFPCLPAAARQAPGQYCSCPSLLDRVQLLWTRLPTAPSLRSGTKAPPTRWRHSVKRTA